MPLPQRQPCNISIFPLPVSHRPAGRDASKPFHSHRNIVLDGAHNPAGARALAKHIGSLLQRFAMCG